MNIYECQLCKQTFKSVSPRAFTGTMRRHRTKKHPKHKGTIKYTVIKPQNN